MIRIGFSAACVLLCLLAQAERVEACSCGGTAPSSLALKHAAAVFVGTVTDVTGLSGARPVIATFRVTKVYRGRVGDRVLIQGNGSNCDVQFARTVDYLVYALEHAGVITTHKCTRTRSLLGASEDLRYLENLEAGRPQALVHGDVFRRILGADGKPAQQSLFETLDVVAVGAAGRRSVSTERWGPYQIVLAPGEYELWVERAGRRVTDPQRLRLSADEVRQLSFTADYQ